jgi:hypothetical protein
MCKYKNKWKKENNKCVGISFTKVLPLANAYIGNRHNPLAVILAHIYREFCLQYTLWKRTMKKMKI